MLKKGTDLRKGDILKHEGGIYRITDAMHNTPGNKRGMMITKLQNIETGKNSEYRFRSDETAEIVELERRSFQFLYDTTDAYVFMHPDTFDQVEIPKDFLGERGKFLQPEMLVQTAFYESRPIDVILPKSVTVQIATTEPNIRGGSVTSSYKPATLTNGVVVQVPPFVESGEWISINSETLDYQDRVKK